MGIMFHHSVMYVNVLAGCVEGLAETLGKELLGGVVAVPLLPPELLIPAVVAVDELELLLNVVELGLVTVAEMIEAVVCVPVLFGLFW